MDQIDRIYYSLLGELLPQYAVPWVENAYAAGSACELHYSSMLAAYDRLRGRLGAVDEDDDVETILHAMLETQHILCRKMFELGMQYREIGMGK